MSTEKGLAPIVIMMPVAVVVIFCIAGFLAWQQYRTLPAPEPVFCTQDAKQCPDGSYVGRTGPNCEFAVCPVQNTNSVTTDWKTYQNDVYPISFNYPGNWVVEKRFSDRSSLPEGLAGFTIYLESNKLEAIHIDATERWCDDLSESGFTCVPIGPHLVYTISKNEATLEVFNKITPTLKFTR